MPEVEEWDQLALDIPGGPGEVRVVKHRRLLPVKPCLLCKKPILLPWLSGSKTTKKLKGGGVDHAAGVRIKLEPETVPGGDFYVVGKTAHRRFPEDIHPSFVFYVEHDCIATSK